MLPWFTVGGADTVVENLVRHWTLAGRTVVVVTTLGAGDDMKNQLADLMTITPFVYELPNYLPRHLWYPFVRSIATALGEPTILNVGSTWFYEHATRLKADLPAIRVVDQQFNDKGHVEANRAAGAAIDMTVTAYKALQTAIDEHANTAMTNIYIGIDENLVTPEDALRARSDLGVPDTQAFAVFVGRLSDEKRPGWLVPLADALQTHGHRLVIVGTGPLAKRYRKQFETHPAIVWKRHVVDATAIIAASAVTVLPSKIEGIPLTAMESLAVGTPVVATAVGGLPELVDVEGVNLVDPDHLEEFIEAVLATMADPKPSHIDLPGWLRMSHMLRAYDAVVE